jgi:hypothetical protein
MAVNEAVKSVSGRNGAALGGNQRRGEEDRGEMRRSVHPCSPARDQFLSYCRGRYDMPLPPFRLQIVISSCETNNEQQ